MQTELGTGVTVVDYFFLNQSALICTYFCHSAGKSSLGKIARTGHSSTHKPQSMHVSGSMYNWVASVNVVAPLTG